MSVSGNLSTMPFADVLQWVSQSRKTGTLVVEGPRLTKKIYFQDGTVIAVASENPREFLGYYLVGWGYIAEEELRELLDMQQRHGTLLGELLVIIGRMDRDELEVVLKVKAEETVYDLFLWKEGGFRFLDGILPSMKFQPLGLSVDGLVLEGMRRLDEMDRISKVIPSAEWVPRLARALDMDSLGPRERRVLAEIDGVRCIQDVALEARLPDFVVYDFVFQCIRIEAATVLPPRGEQAPIPGFSEGSWRLLLRDVQGALKQGELLDAFRRLTEVREKYREQREVQEHAAALERKIAQRMEARWLVPTTVLELAVPSAELTDQSFTPGEGFLLSRINGVYTLGEVLAQVPGPELEHRLVVDSLVGRGVLRVKGETGA